jgi:hypothetical protein
MKILLFVGLSLLFLCGAWTLVPNRLNDNEKKEINTAPRELSITSETNRVILKRSVRHGLDGEQMPRLNVLDAEDQRDQTRVKRKTKKGNLDNLYPSLAIRSVNVNMDWINFTKATNVTQIGTSFVLSDGRTLVSHVMNIGTLNNYYTIPALEPDRVYRGEIKILTDREEVKNFIRKHSNRKYAEEFELTTPFTVPGKPRGS